MRVHSFELPRRAKIMKKILFVNACMRPESRTLILAKHVLSKLDGDVEEVKLDQENIPSLNGKTADLRYQLVEEQKFDDPLLRYAKQFVAADTIVIGAPYWDLSFPSMMKTYMEAVTVCGISFYYTPEGIPTGLCHAKELIYVTSAGGPIMEPDWGFGYIESLAKIFYGIPKVSAFKAENLDIIGADIDGIMAKAKAEIDTAFQS